MSKKIKIPTDGASAPFGENPFSALESAAFAAGAPPPAAKAPQKDPPPHVRCGGRLELRREKQGRGGKTVTTLRGEGFEACPPARLDALLSAFKKQTGRGGTRKERVLEFAGDCRAQAESFFGGLGFRVVRAGG